MSTVLITVVLLAAGLAAWLLTRDLRTVPPGLDLRTTPPTESPSVSVVIPARDEAVTLPALLLSLHRLTCTPREIVVVDDGSQDATAAIARAAGARVVSLTGPPPGWTGKAWACQVGADTTDGELLLFLDADAELAPDALTGLLAAHDQHGGLVSVQPFHDVGRPYEQLSSYFNLVSLLASAAFTRRVDGRPAPRPMAFGPCLLTSRTDYERAGGHEVVRGEVLDDVQLAAAYRRIDLPVRCYVGGSSMRMRMYPGGVRQLAEGWTKNFASGASAAAPGPTLAVVGWVSAQHAVAVGGVIALLAVTTGHPTGLVAGRPGLWAVAWVAVAWQLRHLLRRIGSFRWWTWAVFPLPLIAFDLLFARSLVLTLVRRSVRWHGRDVRLPGHRPATKDV